MSERGLILVNTGNGKGKTTAALGVVLRAVGQGLKVLILQFIKSGHGYGELEGLKKLGDAVTIKSMGKGFIYYNRDKVTVEELEKHKAAAQEAWKTLVEEVNSDKWDLIVMDEINNAINYELIDVNSVVDMLKHKPERLHVILTGRYAKPEIIDIADTVLIGRGEANDLQMDGGDFGPVPKGQTRPVFPSHRGVFRKFPRVLLSDVGCGDFWPFR